MLSLIVGEGVNKSSPTISPTSTKPLIAYIIFKSDAKLKEKQINKTTQKSNK